MQKTKTIQAGDRPFTVRELPVRVIWDLVNNGKDTGEGLDRMRNLLTLACPDLTEEVLMNLYPSEIEELWAAFEEVNAAFLGLVRKVGLDKAILAAVTDAVTDSIRLSAWSSAQGTVPAPGITGTVSS